VCVSLVGVVDDSDTTRGEGGVKRRKEKCRYGTRETMGNKNWRVKPF